MTETGHENAAAPRLEATARDGGGFLIGLVGGAIIGAAAGMLFAPQISAAVRNLRRQLADGAAGASDAASASYRAATTGVGDAVDDLQHKGRAVYENALSAVVRSGKDVKEPATRKSEVER